MSVKNVLVIDTDELFISKLNGFFWDAGIKNVLTASTVAEGIDKIRKQKPDIVLLDFLSPDVDSFEAIQMVFDADSSIRLLVTTEIYNKDYCNAVFDAGADAFIDKNNFSEDIRIILNAVPKSLNVFFEKYLISKN